MKRLVKEPVSFFHHSCASTAGTFCHKHSAGQRDGDCPYSILGLPPGSSAEAVRTAYLELCRRHHPDVGGNVEHFKKIQLAYESCRRNSEDPSGKTTASPNRGASANSEAGEGKAPPGWQSQKAEQKYQEYSFFREGRERAWFYGRSDGPRPQPANKNQLLRETFMARFEAASDAAAVDVLLVEALESGAYDTERISEPLILALRQYHHYLGLGMMHVERCFAAMDLWASTTKRRLQPQFYHVLLTIYSDVSSEHFSATDSTETTQAVTAVLEHMTEAGLPHDDWALLLANRVFRTSPFPDW